MQGKALLIIPLSATIILTGLCIYFYFDPSDSALFPKCAFHTLTGWQCPGCGSQRAIHAMLHGDFATVFRFNAMMVAALPIMLILCVGECLRIRYPRLYMRLNSKWMIWSAFAVVTGWWIFRNLLNV